MTYIPGRDIPDPEATSPATRPEVGAGRPSNPEPSMGDLVRLAGGDTTRLRKIGDKWYIETEGRIIEPQFVDGEWQLSQSGQLLDAGLTDQSSLGATGTPGTQGGETAGPDLAASGKTTTATDTTTSVGKTPSEDGGSASSTTSGDSGDDTTPIPAGVELNLNGATLVKVQEPSGMRYYVEYPVYGVTFRYEVGDQASFDALGPQEWPSIVTLTPAELNQRSGLDVGLIDERFGLAEDPQQTVDRQLRIFGLEDIPQWQRESNEAMTVLLTAADEGWSPGRALTELSKTQAFQGRFPGLDEFRSVLGGNTTLSDALNAYVQQEDSLRRMLQQVRGPDTNVSYEYLGEVIATGWTTQEVSQILDFERRLDDGALDNLNEILVAQGQAPVDATTLLNLARGDNDAIPVEVVEMLNDALRAAELEQQGIFVGASLAADLGEGQALALESTEALRSQAQAAAVDIFANRRELDLGKFGLTEEQLLRAAFNGEASAEVATRLGQLARERSTAAQGFEQFTSYVDERGRGRTLGIDAL